MKVFIGLTEIAGYFENLAEGIRRNGTACDFYDLGDHPFRYAEPRTRLLKLNRRLLKSRLLRPVRQLLKLMLLVSSLFKYDAFIFNSGKSFFNNIDLPLFKLFKKKIVYVFTGSDSRPPYINGAVASHYIFKNGGFDADRCIEETRGIKRNLSRIERYADYIVCNVLSAQFHTRPVVSYLHMGIPFTPREKKTVHASREIRILHSPSHPEAKGTAEIRAAVENLKEEGLPVVYKEISGKPHEEVLKALSGCDLVVDQLYSDTPMAGFAAEAAGFAKPSVVGGYGWDETRRLIPRELMPPSHICRPDDILPSLRKIVADRVFREELGRKAHDFMEKNWAPKEVAARYLRLLREGAPEEWIYNPSEVTYVHGACIHEDRMLGIVDMMIRRGGTGSLQLNDKPGLLTIFEELLAKAGKDNGVAGRGNGGEKC